MRLLIGALLLSVPMLHADTVVDGVAYNWSYLSILNDSVVIQIDFDKPITAYAGDITLAPRTPDPEIWLPFGTVKDGGIDGPSGRLLFDVAGTVPNYDLPDGVSQFNITVGYSAWGSGMPVDVNFTSLTDPPAPSQPIVPQANSPEPATFSLIGLGLFALFHVRRLSNRRNRPASTGPRGYTEPAQ